MLQSQIQDLSSSRTHVEQNQVNKNLVRRIKRRIHAQCHNLRIHCPVGLADACVLEASEITRELLSEQDSPPIISNEEGGIAVKHINYRNALQFCLQMKTARDILWTIAKHRAASRGELSDALKKVEWDLFLPRETTCALRVTSRRSRLYHERMIAEIFEKNLKNQSFNLADKKSASNLIDVRFDRDHFEIAISLSGGDLFRRGFKCKLRSSASIKEDLVACATIWTEKFARQHSALASTGPINVLIPFAGSGTLGFEAALRFAHIPLSRMPRALACERLPCTPIASFRHICQKLEAVSAQSRGCSLRFVEICKDQYQALIANTEAFGNATHVLNNCDMTATQADVFISDDWIGDLRGDAFVPLNPPYGLRLAIQDSCRLYHRTGEWVQRLSKRNFCSLSGYIFAPDTATAQAFVESTWNFSHQSLDVRHGGRKIQLIAFASKKP